MLYYRNAENKIYAYNESPTRTQKSEKGLTLITEDEAREILAPSLEELKSMKISEINQACKSEIISGFISSAIGDEYVYQAEETDQLNLVGVVASGEASYYKCKLYTSDDWEYVLHTAEQLKQVLNDGKNTKLTLLQKAGTIKTQVASATSKEEIEGISW